MPPAPGRMVAGHRRPRATPKSPRRPHRKSSTGKTGAVHCEYVMVMAVFCRGSKEDNDYGDPATPKGPTCGRWPYAGRLQIAASGDLQTVLGCGRASRVAGFANIHGDGSRIKRRKSTALAQRRSSIIPGQRTRAAGTVSSIVAPLLRKLRILPMRGFGSGRGLPCGSGRSHPKSTPNAQSSG